MERREIVGEPVYSRQQTYIADSTQHTEHSTQHTADIIQQTADSTQQTSHLYVHQQP
jgi:hypothetical protein